MQLNQFKKNIKSLLQRLEIYRRDLINKLKYGWHAPKNLELIWINPQKVNSFIPREEIKRVTGKDTNNLSGEVIDWDKIENYSSLMDQYRIQYCYEHWGNDKSWEELGVFEFMAKTKKYGNWSEERIKARFHMLDSAFSEVREMGRLKQRKEIDSSNFREKNGILIHIGKNGKPYFGGGGFHRLAMAKVLKLNVIPACLGVIDKDALPMLSQMRKPPSQ